MLSALGRRIHRRSLHGHNHIARQRRLALILVVTALIRVAAWTTMIVLYLSGVPFTAALFGSVAFVAVISLYANAATDFGQFAASLAQLTAADAHHDAEAGRRELNIDFVQLESDVQQLAALAPGPAAEALASDIRSRLP